MRSAGDVGDELDAASLHHPHEKDNHQYQYDRSDSYVHGSFSVSGGNARWLLRYQGPEQRSREGADANGRVQHGAGSHSVLVRTVVHRPGGQSGTVEVSGFRDNKAAPDPGSAYGRLIRETPDGAARLDPERFAQVVAAHDEQHRDPARTRCALRVSTCWAWRARGWC